MTSRQKFIRRSKYTLIVAILLFLAIAEIGRWREQNDEKVMVERYQRYEKVLRKKIESIGDGIPEDDFKKMFPFASYDKDLEEYIISITTDFSVSPSTHNEAYEVKYFLINNGLVVLDHNRSSIGMCHSDLSTHQLYYFLRAWRSDIDPDWPPVE